MQGYLQEASLLQSCYCTPFLQVMWRCQFCLYSLSCWKRPPENVVFETASSIHIESKQKIERRDWWGWFGFGEGNGCFWAGITQLAPSGHVRRGEQVMTGYKSVCFVELCVSGPLATARVFFSIPSVNIPVSQDCSLHQVSQPILLWFCLLVDVAQGNKFFHSLAPGCLASSLFCRHCIYCWPDLWAGQVELKCGFIPVSPVSRRSLVGEASLKSCFCLTFLWHMHNNSLPLRKLSQC